MAYQTKDSTQSYLQNLYQNRFSPKQQDNKLNLWRVLIKQFLQKYIPENAEVLDIAGGYCEFINNVSAKTKFLVDLNPDSHNYANNDVTVLNQDILAMYDNNLSLEKQFDRIFTSNFFEHLNSKEDLVKVLKFSFDHLKPGGSLLIIQPNFKYSYKEYYDFIDHHLPITHLSLQELLLTIGYQIDVMIPKFLPFSTKGRPSSPALLKAYLMIPLAWKLLGSQMFIKASKPIN